MPQRRGTWEETTAIRVEEISGIYDRNIGRGKALLEQQAQMLRLLRCDQAQGFLFSKPLPAEELEALLKPL